jgi:hypothetical protein
LTDPARDITTKLLISKRPRKNLNEVSEHYDFSHRLTLGNRKFTFELFNMILKNNE